MPSELFGEQAQDDETDDSSFELSKVIVRSNGTVTYVGKDIAYQLWKFGLLGKDFRYEPFRTYPSGREAWVSTAEAGSGNAPAFGGGQAVYNVIDVRQSYLQDVVRAGLEALGHDKEAESSIHFSYEMVASVPALLRRAWDRAIRRRQAPALRRGFRPQGPGASRRTTCSTRSSKTPSAKSKAATRTSRSPSSE